MAVNKDITIIVPIHNRILFFPQILEYYNRFKDEISLKIVAADSSSSENSLKNKEIIARYPDLDIIHVSITGTNQTLYDKIIEALRYVDTEYCVCCADDDFITISGLKETVNFLKNNPDFSVAHGAYISFYTDGEGEKSKFYWQPMYFKHSVVSDKPIERLKDQFSNCRHTLYAVHRTKILKKIYSEVQSNLNSNVKILLFGEYLSTMLATIMGKIKDLDVFYSARREHAIYQGQHIKWPLIRDYVENGTIDGEADEFKKCMEKYLLLAQPELSENESHKVVNDCFESGIKNSLPPDRFRKLVLNTSLFLKNKDYPNWIYNIFKNIYRTFFPVKRGGTTKDFSGTRLSLYNEDLRVLKEVVMSGKI